MLAAIASEMIWMPVTSVEAERSFSNYKNILNDRRESLTQENTKRLMMLYYNGDVQLDFLSISHKYDYFEFSTIINLKMKNKNKKRSPKQKIP